MAEPKKNKEFKVKKQGFREVVSAQDIIRKDGFDITVRLKNTDAATAANFSQFYIAHHPIEVKKVQVVYDTASTSGTLQIEKLTGTTAPGSGTNLLTTTFDLSATANTVQTKEGVALGSGRILKTGERLALVDGGTLTNLNNLVVTVYCVYKGNGNYR